MILYKKLGLHDPDGPLNCKFTPHCCRHWYTTHLSRAGMSKEYVQELRGDSHQDAFDIYNHIDPEDLREEYLACIPVLGIEIMLYEDRATMATETGFEHVSEHQRATMATMATKTWFKNPFEPQRATMATMATNDQALRGMSHDIYSLICDIPGLKPSEIAKYLNKKPNYIRSYLHRLEKQGAIYKDNYSRCFIKSPSSEIQSGQSRALPETMLMEACHG